MWQLQILNENSILKKLLKYDVQQFLCKKSLLTISEFDNPSSPVKSYSPERTNPAVQDLQGLQRSILVRLSNARYLWVA
jgi:hypothetical protein